MNVTTLHSRTLRILNTNSDNYSTETFLSDLNEAIALRTLDILRLRGYKEVTANYACTTIVNAIGLSEGDNGYNGEYAIPEDTLDLIRIEISKSAYGETSDDYFVINEGELYSLKEKHASEVAVLDKDFSTSKPVARITRGAISIRPLPKSTVLKGLWFFYKPRQLELTEDTDYPAFEENLHQILLYDCAEMEMLSHPENFSQTKMSLISKKRNEVEDSFKDFYRERLRQDEGIKITQENFS